MALTSTSATSTSAMKAGNTLIAQVAPTGLDTSTGKYTTAGTPSVTVGDAVNIGDATFYVKTVDNSGFILSASPGGSALTTTAPTLAAIQAAGVSYVNNPIDSLALDQVGTVAGLKDLNANLDAEATIQATSTAKSTATTGGVSGEVASLAEIASNAGLTYSAEINSANKIDVASNATLANDSASTLVAAASTTNGAAASVADLGRAAGIERLSDLDVGGSLSMVGKSVAGISASSDTVTGEVGATAALSGSQLGLQTTGLADIKADASLQGITQLTNTATAATFSSATATGKGLLDDVVGADALASAGNIQGATLEDLNIGGIGTVLGQTGLTNNATASNVDGAATAFSSQGGGGSGSGFMEGLDLQGPMDVKSDAGITGTANLSGKAVASTTKGAASADAEANILNGADLTGGTLDVGGIADLKGNLNYGLTSEASNVEGGTARAEAQANTATGLAGMGSGNANPLLSDGVTGLDLDAAGSVSGISIGSLKATASSTASGADAFAGAGDTATGAQLPSLDIGGIGTITGAAQLTSTAAAESVAGATTATAGNDGSVVGLSASGQTAETNELSNLAGLSDLSLDNFNINVASDATIGAQAFSNLSAQATSTGGDATAEAGGSSTNGSGVATPGNTVTGIASGMDIKVGGVGTLTALAQGTATAGATSVTDDADALGAMAALGINDLEMTTSSDATMRSTATLVGKATAATTGDAATPDTAWAGLDLDSKAVSGLALDVGGIGNLTGSASITGEATAEVVTGDADARADIDAMGVDNVWMQTASNGTVAGTGLLNLDVVASTSAGNAKAEGDFDATGASRLYIGNTEFTGTNDDFVGIGGVANLKGQAQVTAEMTATSVSGQADAFSGVDLGNGGTMNFTATVSRIAGLDDVDLRGASDGILLGTAKGVFSTKAESTGADANAKAAQSLLGINDLNLNLGGMGQISAIVNDTNFVGAQSVSGNATAVSTLDAVGLAGGDMHIAGNASITATVGIDSKSESLSVA